MNIGIVEDIELPRSGRPTKFTPARIEQIRNLVERGKTREEIAEITGCTVGSLRVTCSKLGVSLRRRLFARLAVDFDRAFHAGILDRGLARDFELPQFAIAQDAGLVDAALGRDARALHFFAGGDLGFLQLLCAGHFELLDRAPALEAGDVERLFAHHVGAAHVLGGDDIGLLHAPIGVGTLHELGGVPDLRDDERSTTQHPP